MLLNHAVNSHFTLCMYVHGPANVCECTDKHTQSVHACMHACVYMHMHGNKMKVVAEEATNNAEQTRCNSCWCMSYCILVSFTYYWQYSVHLKIIFLIFLKSNLNKFKQTGKEKRKKEKEQFLFFFKHLKCYSNQYLLVLFYNKTNIITQT